MAEKGHQSPSPLAQTNGYVRSDQEAGTANSKELRKKKRMKCLLYIVIFAVFQIIVITAFSLTVMRIKNPKFRVDSASFETFSVVTTTDPSFNIQMNTRFAVKNTNFGHFKFENGTVTFAYMGMTVGVATIEKARARARSTKRVNARVDLSSSNLADNSVLGRDLNSNILRLTSSSKLDGKIHLMKVIKKKKSAQMNCTMDINITTRTLQNIVCK